MDSTRGIRRIAINTGGRDAPGLNAVIRAATPAALENGWEVLGIRRGYMGLLHDDTLESNPQILQSLGSFRTTCRGRVRMHGRSRYPV